MISLLADTGIRRGELAGLAVGDVVFERSVVVVSAGSSKSRRSRAVPFGTRTAKALDRYVRARRRHPTADRDELWLGLKGPMTERDRPGPDPALPDGWAAPDRTARLPPHVRPRVPRGRRQRGRPDAPDRLEEPEHGRSIRKLDRGRAGAGRISVAGRSTVSGPPKRPLATRIELAEELQEVARRFDHRYRTAASEARNGRGHRGDSADPPRAPSGR